MKIAFYKNGGTFFDGLIRAVTQGKYSHCEIIFDQIFGENELWFTASSRDRGVRLKNIIPIAGHWDIIKLDVDKQTEQYAFNWANSQIARKYNYLGVARFVIPALPDNDDKWFCSEICAAILQMSKKLDPYILANSISPTALYYYII